MSGTGGSSRTPSSVPSVPGRHEDAIEDFNRLLTHARWDADLQRYVRTDLTTT